MICKACAQGADYLTKITAARDDVALYQGDRVIATRYHEFCDGCDCQHRVDLQVEGRSVRT